MKKKKGKQLGQLLIEKEVITHEQLDQALEVQLKEGGLLGQILIKLDIVSAEQIENSMYEQTSSAQKLEHALKELGVLSAEQLTQALELQKKDSITFAQAIVTLGVLGEEDLVSTMVTQFGYPYLQLVNYEIEPEIVKIIPKSIAEKYSLVAIDKIGNILTIAMADPLNASALDEIRKETGLNVEAFISTFSDINNAVAQFYI
ncbi:MAG: hypothetical protein KAS13_07005 [Candidatus Omnitrophica bacterium]|nr:hypothetical protein [Candidatus Omnitrophota bacterium]